MLLLNSRMSRANLSSILQVFICILSVGSIIYWFWVPETKSAPLEELAAIFGDTDEVKIYSNDIFVNDDKQVVTDDHHHTGQSVTEKEELDVVILEKV
jgi:hypothetical protein